MSTSGAADPTAAAAADADSAAEEQWATELAQRAGAGELAAMQVLLRHLTPALTRVVVSVLGSHHADRDDVVQQSLIAVQRALPAFRGECHPAGYATRIALRVALRARRTGKLDFTRRETIARLSPEGTHVESPSQTADAEHRRRVLRDLLQDLPVEQADALGLRVMLGWSLDEVARATGAPLNTVRSRVRLAKEALRKRIERDPLLADLKGVP
jgi:RNA polymerase sigma-70 factor (ECF subfamily)